MCNLAPMMSSKRADIEPLAVRLVQAYGAVRSKEVLQELAATVAALRGCIVTSEGVPDWAGRSYEYRQTMSGIYDASGMDRDVIQAVQNGLRYHLGNYLRETLSADELRSAGLRVVSPKDRIEGARSDLLARARSAGMDAPSDLADALGRIEVALRSAIVQARGSRPEARKAAQASAKTLAALVRDLRKDL